ncbi:CmpA/NrtA family ABC transporter substrate-binding protein [uncultured Roseibium sp.]|uniref:CmpA/NrtA family ABC transporter substrate-binding protein n=1 Tax=uncultured Roseibium sp. TaxID=1936171 RepID=UPI003216C34B
MSHPAAKTVIAGFIPLLDSALLVAAARCGFAEEEGIELKLVRETSWANIRDRISIGHFDVAHMLAPMPIAATLNLTSLSVPMLAPMTLGLGGNAISVSLALWKEMKGEGADGAGDPASTGEALAKVISIRRAEGKEPLRFGVVHPFSGHAYELRYWLAATGIDPDRDVEITVLPPPLMPDALLAGRIDGYCVGEPWNTISVQNGIGRIVTFKDAIWPASPEKVLGVTESWAGQNAETLQSLIRALIKAADWCANWDNAEDLAHLLAAPDYLDCAPETCIPALTGKLQLEPGLSLDLPRFLSFAGPEALCPTGADGLWFYSQMVRWGQAAYSKPDAEKVVRTFDDRLFRDALGYGGGGSGVVQAPKQLFDGVEFDPENLAKYIASFPVQTRPAAM